MKRLWGKKLVRIISYLVASYLVLVLGVAIYRVANPQKSVNVAAIPTCQPDTSQLLSFINQERAKIGSPQLTVDSALATSAHNKLNDEVMGQYFGHKLLDGSSPHSFITAQGVNAAWSEDISSNALNPTVDWASFKGSPTHYASLTDPQYTRVGIAELCSNYKIAKETDATEDIPIGTQVSELTVVHLAAPEPVAAAPAPVPTYVAPKARVTTCYPAYFSNPATCITR